jgi:alpha-mannosidase
MLKKIYTFFFFIVLISSLSFSQDEYSDKISLTRDGFIPFWLVVGPFEQPLVGFGVPTDSDVIAEKEVDPFWGKKEKSILVKNETAKWFPQSVTSNGFLNFNNSLRWQFPGNEPEKIWYAITGYAAAYIHSPVEQNVILTFGSNSFGKVFVNHKEVYSIQNSRNAKVDEDTINVSLKKGENLILVKVGNSNANHALAFWGMIKWEWGFYLKVLNKDGNPSDDLKLILPEKINEPELNVVSTFFFKNINGKLNQRFDFELISPFVETSTGEINFKINQENYSFDLNSIPFGLSRHQIFISEINDSVKTKVTLGINNQIYEKEIEFFPKPHYELHMMMLAHTDIGYTHPQPVVKELHTNTLDEVVEMCNQYPDFDWTIETLWQLEQFEQSRSSEQFQKVIDLIKEGRIAVSPLYSNPFTGWVGEEEMIRSLNKAKEYKEKFGLTYNAAVYNDVPGQAWFIPQVLNKAGVTFLAEGINEFFNNYSFQRSLPKAFLWEGSDSSSVVTYLTEAYNEGASYGLEGRGNFAVQQRMWQKLNKLQSRDYNFEIVLLNSAYTDNSIVPKDQFYAMQEWNKEFEYPKFISSNVSKFAEEFYKRYKDSLQIIKGDWTSNWDIFYQGEFDRNKKQRWVQHNLLSAEKLSALTWLLDEKKSPLTDYIDLAYSSTLNFSGHGSGLEYGYGSPEENKITMEYREKYIHDAYLNTEEVLERSIHRITKPEESFDGEGVIVFNTLSWIRDAVVEIQYPFADSPLYDIIDLTNQEKVPSFREGYKQIFVARDLPSFGFKKFRLQQVSAKDKPEDNGLMLSDNSVENQFYKITFDKASGKVESILDKKSNKELNKGESEYGFNHPLMERFQKNENYKKLNFSNQSFEIKNESPVRIILQIKREDELFEKSEFILWNNIDRVDIEHTVNLEKFEAPETIEDYGLAFPFAVEEQNIELEILGGFVNPEDRLPGSSKEGFSIRRTAALYNDEHTVSLTSLDSRIMKLRYNDDSTSQTLISNPVNNFPVNWNRHEENEGKIVFRYSFTNQQMTFSAPVSARFGWELNTPPVVRKSWYKSEPSNLSYFKIDNENIFLQTIIPSAEDKSISLRLSNLNPEKKETGIISSKIFKNGEAFFTSYLGEKKDLQ